MARLNDIGNAPVRFALANCNTVKAGLTTATTTTAVKTVAATNYTINGIYYTKAITDNMAITTATGPVNASTTTYVQPLNTVAYYVVCLDAAGALSIVQGSYAGQPLGGGAIGDGSIPDVPTTVCAIGIFKLSTTTAAFTIGTTAVTSAAVGTATFYDILGVIPVGAI